MATSSASSFNQAPPPCLLVLESIGGGGTCLWPRRLSCFFLLLYSCGYCGLLGLGSCHAACLQSSASSASYRPTLSPHHCINPACNISCGEWVQAECTRVMCVRVCLCVCARVRVRVAAGPSRHSPQLHTSLSTHAFVVLLTPISSCPSHTQLLSLSNASVALVHTTSKT